VKDVPDIAPEVRGLLEEIVADPRSAIRLAPRRALSTWFDAGETARVSDIARTKAERHLVEAHREELAELLCEASWISYWKTPGFAVKPVGANGQLYQPASLEPDWVRRARAEDGTLLWGAGATAGIALLQECLLGIRPQQGLALASASLSLIPSDRTRCYVALNIPWSHPRAAIYLWRRLEKRAQPRLRPDILLSLGARACCIGLLNEARKFYRVSNDLNPHSPYGLMCTFNLSCFLGEIDAAKREAEGLHLLISREDPRLKEVSNHLREWTRTREVFEVKQARDVCERIHGDIPESAEVLRQAIIS